MLSEAPAPLVVLFDVDNTLLDNDRFALALRAKLQDTFGKAQSDRYWSIYATLREELGYADYLGALQRFRFGLDTDPALLELSDFLLEFPFDTLLYPRALDVLAHVRGFGTAAILSDGDIVFQPRKIRRAGIRDAVAGNIIVDLHKQTMLEPMQKRFPAAHYAMVDDKPQILRDMKRILGDRLTTVFVQQGHYAADAPQEIRDAADRSIPRIDALLGWSPADFLAGAAARAVA